MSLRRLGNHRITFWRLYSVVHPTPCQLLPSGDSVHHTCQHRQHVQHRTPLHIPTSSLSLLNPTSQPDIPGQDREKGRLIYVGTLSSMIKNVKIFSLSTSAMGLAAQPFIYQRLTSLPPVLAAGIGGFLGFSVLVMPVLLHFVTKRYVNDIYYNPETGQFTASAYTLFLRRREYKFTADDVKVHEIPRLFSTVKVSGVPLYIDQMLFTDRKAGVHLFGYDKPMDFKIHVDDLKDDDENKNKNDAQHKKK